MFSRRVAAEITSESTGYDPEWDSALDAADRALTALRDATAHRNGLPTIDDRPTPGSSLRIIRDWILDVRRVVAKAVPLVLSAVAAPSDGKGLFNSPSTLAATLGAAADRIAALHDLNVASSQRGRTWSLPDATRTVVPGWTSRRHWLAQVEHALTTETGRATCVSRRTSPDVVLRHAAVYANHADGRTGRGVTVSRSTIIKATGMSETADKRARRVLRDLQLLVDGALGRTLTTTEFLAATLHHGSTSQSRAASTLHLTTPQHLAHIRAASTAPKKSTTSRRSGRDPLSVSGFSPAESSSTVGTHQTRERARGQRKNSKTDQARPLHLQRAAAQLRNRAPALRRIAHIGSICHVIASTGIDTTTWTGQDIAAAIDADSRRRGWMWPTEITDPVALFAWRLRRIDWTGMSPSATARNAAENRAAAREAADRSRSEAEANRASAQSRAGWMAQISAQLSATKSRNETRGTAPLASTASASAKVTAKAAARPADAHASSADPAASARSAARAEIAALRKRGASIHLTAPAAA